jgi:hypothetical protein
VIPVLTRLAAKDPATAHSAAANGKAKALFALIVDRLER